MKRRQGNQLQHDKQLGSEGLQWLVGSVEGLWTMDYWSHVYCLVVTDGRLPAEVTEVWVWVLVLGVDLGSIS